MNWLPTLYDLLVVVFIGFMVLRSYRFGFLRQMVLIIGYIFALIGALYLSQMIAQWCCDTFLRGFFLEKMSAIVGNGVQTGSETVTQAVEQLSGALPSFIQSMLHACFGGQEKLLLLIQEGTQGVVSELPVFLTDHVLMPVIIFAVRVIFCLMLFVLFAIIVRAIARLFKHFYAIPILGTVNSMLGGLLGFAQAAIYLYLIGMVLQFVISLTGNGLEWCNDSILLSTRILRIFYPGVTGQI